MKDSEWNQLFFGGNLFQYECLLSYRLLSLSTYHNCKGRNNRALKVFLHICEGGLQVWRNVFELLVSVIKTVFHRVQPFLFAFFGNLDITGCQCKEEHIWLEHWNLFYKWNGLDFEGSRVWVSRKNEKVTFCNTGFKVQTSDAKNKMYVSGVKKLVYSSNSWLRFHGGKI